MSDHFDRNDLVAGDCPVDIVESIFIALGAVYPLILGDDVEVLIVETL